MLTPGHHFSSPDTEDYGAEELAHVNPPAWRQAKPGLGAKCLHWQPRTRLVRRVSWERLSGAG